MKSMEFFILHLEFFAAVTPYVGKEKVLVRVENGSVRKCEADSHEWLLTPWPQKLHFCTQADHSVELN